MREPYYKQDNKDKTKEDGAIHLKYNANSVENHKWGCGRIGQPVHHPNDAASKCNHKHIHLGLPHLPRHPYAPNSWTACHETKSESDDLSRNREGKNYFKKSHKPSRDLTPVISRELLYKHSQESEKHSRHDPAEEEGTAVGQEHRLRSRSIQRTHQPQHRG